MAEKPVFTKIDPPEGWRIYYFPNGEKFSVNQVAGLAVSPSGTHRLETADGRKFIVPVGWLAIELDIENWTL